MANALMQFKAMILTNEKYTPEQRHAAAKLLESIDQDLETSGPYEPSDNTEELLVEFNNSLCEIDPEEDVDDSDDDEDDAGTRREDLLEGLTDADEELERK